MRQTPFGMIKQGGNELEETLLMWKIEMGDKKKKKKT